MKRKTRPTSIRTILADYFREMAVTVGRKLDALGAVGLEAADLELARQFDEGESVAIEGWRLHSAVPGIDQSWSYEPVVTVHPDGTYTAGEPATIAPTGAGKE